MGNLWKPSQETCGNPQETSETLRKPSGNAQETLRKPSGNPRKPETQTRKPIGNPLRTEPIHPLGNYKRLMQGEWGGPRRAAWVRTSVSRYYTPNVSQRVRDLPFLCSRRLGNEAWSRPSPEEPGPTGPHGGADPAKQSFGPRQLHPVEGLLGFRTQRALNVAPPGAHTLPSGAH